MNKQNKQFISLYSL